MHSMFTSCASSTASVPGLHPTPNPQRMTRKHASRADSGASEESPETGDPAEAGGGHPCEVGVSAARVIGPSSRRPRRTCGLPMDEHLPRG